MKKFNKTTAIILSVIMGVVLVVGLLFSFVPMNFGTNKWKSFSGSVSLSSDITGGLYGEFKIKTENPSKQNIVSSMQKIKDVFEEDGYKIVNVYAVGTEKIRVETGYSKTGRSYAEVYNKIASIAVGAFSLRSTYELKDESIIVKGYECVDDISVFTNNDTNYISIRFNKTGEEQYKNLCEKADSSKIYIVLGDYAQEISIAGVSTYSEFTLSDSDYENMMTLKTNIVLGCMSIELDTSSAKINTMSASLSAGESAGTPEVASYASSTVYVLVVVAVASIAVLILVYFAIRFGLYAVLMLITMIFNGMLFVIALNLMPSVELGMSSFVALAIGFAVIYTYAFRYAAKVKSEYNEGKSLSASLEAAYKKTMPSTLVANITLFVSALVFLAFSFGEITSAAIVFAVCTFLSLFTNLLIVPFLVKICISFKNFGFKLFMLKKRMDFAEAEDTASLKEAK